MGASWADLWLGGLGWGIRRRGGRDSDGLECWVYNHVWCSHARVHPSPDAPSWFLDCSSSDLVLPCLVAEICLWHSDEPCFILVVEVRHPIPAVSFT